MDDGQQGQTGPEPARQPPPKPPGSPPDPSREWWRAASDAPDSELGQEPAGARIPPRPASPPRPVGPAAEDGPDGDEPSTRDEVRETWREHGQDAVEAAHEIGAYIGDAIAAHLPDPQAAAQRRGLDIRWMHLRINIPAIVITLLGVWRGDSLADHTFRLIHRDGLLAPFGVILLFGLLILILATLPIGGPLLSAVSHLITWLTTGIVRGVRQGWNLPYIGYLLRLVLAVACWSCVIAVIILAGRGIIHILTGV